MHRSAHTPPTCACMCTYMCILCKCRPAYTTWCGPPAYTIWVKELQHNTTAPYQAASCFTSFLFPAEEAHVLPCTTKPITVSHRSSNGYESKETQVHLDKQSIKGCTWNIRLAVRFRMAKLRDTRSAVNPNRTIYHMRENSSLFCRWAHHFQLCKNTEKGTVCEVMDDLSLCYAFATCWRIWWWFGTTYVYGSIQLVAAALHVQKWDIEKIGQLCQPFIQRAQINCV